MFIIPGYYRMGPQTLVSSSVSTDIAVWDSERTYYKGDYCYGADGITVYECAIGPATFAAGQFCGQEHGVNLDNLNNNPDDLPTVPAMDRKAWPDYNEIKDCYEESGKLWWIKRGQYWENKYRMFQESPDLITTSEYDAAYASMSVTISHIAQFSALAFVRLWATSLRIRIGADVDMTVDLRVPPGLELPAADIYANMIVQLPREVGFGEQFTVDFIHDESVRRHWAPNESVRAECGFIYGGYLVNIGTAQWDTQIGIEDYSQKERDAFGRAIIQQRSFTNRINYKVSIDTNKVYAVSRYLASIRSILSVYVGDQMMPETVVTGYFKNFTIPIQNVSKCIFNIEVEGL